MLCASPFKTMNHDLKRLGHDVLLEKATVISTLGPASRIELSVPPDSSAVMYSAESGIASAPE